MESNKKILQKIQKLLRLANAGSGATLEEALTSAEIAQRLMHTYRISYEVVMAESGLTDNVIASEPVINYIAEFKRHFTPVRNPSAWVQALMLAVARVNKCETYIVDIEEAEEGGRVDKFTGFSIVGRMTDILVVNEIFYWLLSEILRIGFREAKGKDDAWLNDFRLGAVRKLKERLEAVQTNPEFWKGYTKDQLQNAIIQIDKKHQEVKDFYENFMKDRKIPGKTIREDDFIAAQIGYMAADEIALSSPKILSSEKERAFSPGEDPNKLRPN
jgi:hypothetical protein